MKKVFKLSILIIFLTIAAYIAMPAYLFASRWINFSFCDQPITFSVNHIDPSFNISKKQVIKDAREAANIWNNLAKKTIFLYDPSSALDINLVYDERQSNITQISEKREQIDEKQNELSSSVEEFEERREKLTEDLDNLNEEISYWNEKGRTSRDIYNQLIRKQKNLQKEVDKINKMAEQLNTTADQINQQITSVNNSVKKFNELLTVKPEEGVYLGGPNKINIFIYENETSFRHTVTHELGHALGLGHVEEVDSIMYPISSENSRATEADRRLLQNYCLEQNRLDLILNDLKNMFYILYSEINNVVT